MGRRFGCSTLFLSLVVIASAGASAQTPPSKVFIQQNIPLSEIFFEWQRKGLKGDMFICSCDRTVCDTNPYWPFRSFRPGQSIPVLGEFNRDIARSNGFICGLRP